ncbi:DNA-binding transcriptional LysR family regulator [Diaminobutyricimonas aerilata]|uniref:DNA-binding transcriptional LysR family regulator n=1 Tax=Diaminobutyricimonas aerilata TaxID=1162967 RepID=A0A2M9CFL6_9MICO|nr:LysR substrate-binding domain-containing protein [Diaminobutyricimonas aerilata]PJJ70731.1 DNA-binding transcriptional LysR family regulator [Diaminobutyricimonas aerilata]
MTTDLSIRRLRYFVVTAEELNFGRAAEKLHIAQPVLSRQIATLEKELGVTLFERSARGTVLSPAGAALVEDARALLASATRLQRQARTVARGQTRFTIGFMPGVPITPVVRRLRELFPELTVDVVRTGWESQVDVVHDGRVDASFVRLPVSRDDLELVPLFRERRLVALPEGHPLATGDLPSLADIALLDLLQPPDTHPEWRDAAAAARPDALTTARETLPVVSTVEEKLEHVAGGRGIVLLPESAATFYTRPDIVYREVEGLGEAETALAFERSRMTPVLQQLIRIALAAYSADTGARD